MKKPKQTTLLIWLLATYSLIMTGLFIRQYWVHEKQSKDKNFYYTWNVDGTILSMRDNESNRLKSVFYDENSDFNYERTVYYINDRIVSKAFDYDENGVYEKVTYFDLNSNYIGFDQDLDKDDIYEYSLRILENNDSLYFYDINKNNRYDSIRLQNGNR